MEHSKDTGLTGDFSASDACVADRRREADARHHLVNAWLPEQHLLTSLNPEDVARQLEQLKIRGTPPTSKKCGKPAAHTNEDTVTKDTHLSPAVTNDDSTYTTPIHITTHQSHARTGVPHTQHDQGLIHASG